MRDRREQDNVSILEIIWLVALTAVVAWMLWNQWQRHRADKKYEQMIEDSKAIEEFYRPRL